MKRTSTLDILLVEDEPTDIYLIQRAIIDCCPQCRLWLVNSGSEALAFLRNEPPFGAVPTPALILLDLNLPQHDGRAILAELRRQAAYQQTPVIVVSGRDKTVEEPRRRQLWATAYVQKSADFASYFGGVQVTLRDCLDVDGSSQ